MLQLILGGSGSGKTTWLYTEIEKNAKQGQKSILLVPEQFTASTEGRIYHKLGDEYSGRVQSYSFTSLAEKILSVCGGGAIQTLSDCGRAVIVRRAIKQLGNQVVYYQKHRANVAFCQMMAETIDELKSAGISSQNLAHLAAGCGAGAGKLKEIALIYAGYQALLSQTALDPTDRVNLAAQQLETALSMAQVPSFLAGCKIYIDEFDTFNAPKKRLLKALLALQTEVKVALCLDSMKVPGMDGAQTDEKPTMQQDLSLFSSARRVAYDLHALARKAGAGVSTPLSLAEDFRHQAGGKLARLNELFLGEVPEEALAELPENQEVILFSAKTREEEARAVVAQIHALARQGVRYGKMAVVCRDSAVYHRVVVRVMRLADIPLFCDETTTPAYCAPVTAVRALVGILCGVDYTEQMVTLAKTGLCNLPEGEVMALENYIYTWSPKRSDWKLPFDKNPDGFGVPVARETPPEHTPLCETARQSLQPRIETFCRCAKGATAGEVTKAIYECLIALGAQEQQTAQIAALGATAGIPAQEAALREWNVVVGLLNQMSQLLGDEVITPEDYRELFEVLVGACDLGHIPQTIDAVIFTSAAKMRLDNPDYIFVLGLAEGEFPALPSETGLLTHADREALMAGIVDGQQIELSECFEQKLLREGVNLYKALTASKKGLWVSWPDGLGLPLASEVEEKLSPLNPTAPSLTAWSNATTPAAAIDCLGRAWGESPAAVASLQKVLSDIPNTKDTVRTMLQQNSPLPKQTGADGIASLLGSELNISPSKLELYYSCPYHYFLQYVLRLSPRQKAELSPNQSGSLMHWVFQMALDPAKTYWQSNQETAFTALTDEQIANLTAELTQEYRNRYLDDDSIRFDYLLKRVQASMVASLQYLAAEQRQSKFEPRYFEAKIGMGEGEFPPRSYTINGDKTVRVIGTIDRVDEWERPLEKQGEQKEGEAETAAKAEAAETEAQAEAVAETEVERWLRVVDYKTGSKALDLSQVYCGLNCQMLLYLFSLVQEGKTQEVGQAAPALPQGRTQEVMKADETAKEPKAAGVIYLLADPSPENQPRSQAQNKLLPKVDGLVSAERAVYQAMDEAGDGSFLPFAYAGGVPASVGQKNLANPEKMKKIASRLDELVVEMAENLYSGRMEAAPICNSKHDSCQWCDYKMICRHQEGKEEREITAPKGWYEPEKPKKPAARKKQPKGEE